MTFDDLVSISPEGFNSVESFADHCVAQYDDIEKAIGYDTGLRFGVYFKMSSGEVHEISYPESVFE